MSERPTRRGDFSQVARSIVEEATEAHDPDHDFIVKHWPAHAEHPWKQVGSSVYCAKCDVRLYQGELPAHKAEGAA